MQRLGIAAIPAILALMLAVGSAPAHAQQPALQLDRVVMLMRHGVRPPTKSPAMPAGTASDPWPEWPVAPGYLTPHGATGIRLLGRADRAWFNAAGLLPRNGCPSIDMVSLHADSDQRTIATGDAYLDGLAAGCRLANTHRPQDTPDPMFAAAGEGAAPLDPARADRAVAEALGPRGIAGAEASQRGTLGRLDRILCGTAGSSCGITGTASSIVPAAPDKRPKLTGALDRGSTAAQILLLEYAEGKPLTDVGWGRASAANITALSALHSTEFAILARPPYLAARNVEPIARALVAALVDDEPRAPRLLVIVGHDTNVASLGGLLDLHWHVPGYAADDPPPGGAIALELLRDRQGRRFVRASFRAQTLEQLRALAPIEGRNPMARMMMTIAECPALCPLERVRALIDRRILAAR